MKTEVTLEKSIGKTLLCVKASTSSRQMVLVFTDGTFTTLQISRGYEPGDDVIVGGQLKLLDFHDGELIRAGIVTKDELDAMRVAQDVKYRANQEDRDRAELVRLKHKYGAL